MNPIEKVTGLSFSRMKETFFVASLITFWVAIFVSCSGLDNGGGETSKKGEFVSEVRYIGRSDMHFVWDEEDGKKEEYYSLSISYGELEGNFIGTKKEVDSIIPVLKETLIKRSKDLEYLRNKAEKQ